VAISSPFKGHTLQYNQKATSNGQFSQRAPPMCEFPFVGENCASKLADVGSKYYVPAKIASLTMSSLVVLVVFFLTFKVGQSKNWVLNRFQIKLLTATCVTAVLALIRSIDPLGWNGWIPGTLDQALMVVACAFLSYSL
jgi:hypothetical protein